SIGNANPNRFFNQVDAIVAGDFNGDGKVDFGAVSSNDYISVFKGDGTGSFSNSGKSLALTGRATAIGVGDLNGDGKQDLMVAEYSSSGYPLQTFVAGVSNSTITWTKKN